MAEAQQLNLYDLLPALYRSRDEEIGSLFSGQLLGDPALKGPLRELIELIESQAALIRNNIGELYDDFFIETCAEWVVPYIGDLVGNTPLYEISRTRRADVARTLYYRRRKGTRATLEELARDVTGWAAHVVPCFELLEWTQNLNHLRLTPAPDPLQRRPWAFDRVGTVHIRDLEPMDRLDGPFDTVAHTLDVRRISQTTGWYGAKKVGVFLWRLKSFLIEAVPAQRTATAGAHEYFISPLGNPLRLFQRPADLPAQELSDAPHVPAPIRPVLFQQDPSRYYPTPTLRIRHDGADPVPLERILCMNLATWPTPPAGKVGVDVTRGRVSFGAGTAPTDPASVRVDYNYGFPAELGGGPYDRLAPIVARERPQETAEWGAWPPDADGTPVSFDVGAEAALTSIGAAVAAWETAGKPAAVIRIMDNGTYPETVTIELGPDELVLRAENRQRPVLLGDLIVRGDNGEGTLILSGLVIAGTVRVEEDLQRLTISHCTLVPGRTLRDTGEPAEPYHPSLWAVSSATHLRVDIERSITGRLELPATLVSLTIKDSIVDAAGRGERAQPVPVLLSGNLNPMPVLGAGPRKLRVAVGERPERAIQLDPVPTTLAEARDFLQATIRNSLPSDPAYQRVAVILVGNRLAVTSLRGERVWLRNESGDNVASQLRLVAPEARLMLGLLGGNLASFTGFPGAERTVRVHMGLELPATADVLNDPQTPAALRNELQAAIRNAGTGPAFTGAFVGLAEQRLLVIPGVEGVAVTFLPDNSEAVLLAMALESTRPALAGSPGAEKAAVAATIIRSTVLGRAFVHELTLGSETIFTETIRTEKRQTGCVRFSYVAPASETPRRYRCQPDLAIEGLQGADLARALQRLTPAFTSVLYGDPAYGQLALHCPLEVSRGAEDGGEMGAYHLLLNPHRMANLASRLEEYLPFGLEAGVIFVT